MIEDDKELKDQRVVTMMTPSELEAIDDWMFKNRIRSRGEAIRRLCQVGIAFEGTARQLQDGLTEHFMALGDLSNKIFELFTTDREKLTPELALQVLGALQANFDRIGDASDAADFMFAGATPLRTNPEMKHALEEARQAQKDVAATLEKLSDWRTKAGKDQWPPRKLDFDVGEKE